MLQAFLVRALSTPDDGVLHGVVVHLAEHTSFPFGSGEELLSILRRVTEQASDERATTPPLGHTGADSPA